MAIFGKAGRGDRVARRILIPLAVLFVILVTVVWVIHFPLRVDGDSMYPTLHNGDRVLVTRGYEIPAVGDVVVVNVAPRPDLAKRYLVKRVVALPGDTVEIDRGMAIVNGTAENLDTSVILDQRDFSLTPVTVPENHLYVLGDNRPYSLDSRAYGTVPFEQVRGRVTFVFTPVDRLGMVD